MENYDYQRAEILNGHMVGPLWPESMVYLIAVDDNGRFVARAFSDPERYIGSSMAIGGDAMTAAEVAMTFSRALDRNVEFEHVGQLRGIPVPPRPVLGVPQHVRADIAACRELLPDLKTLEDWIAASGWV